MTEPSFISMAQSTSRNSATEKWRMTRTLIAHNYHSVELPQELSEADCTSRDLREFYSRYPETAGTVVFKPGERFKDALSCQPQDVKDARTLILRRKLMQNISHGAWDQLRNNVEEILNVDPLNRRSPFPIPEDWSIPEDSSRRTEPAAQRHHFSHSIPILTGGQSVLHQP